MVSHYLSGASRYIVSLNGRKIETSESSLELPVTGPAYQLSVATDRSCQGVFEESAVIEGALVLYPNPVRDRVHIQINDVAQHVATAHVYDTSGSLLRTETLQRRGAAFELGVSELPSGLYVIKLIAGPSTYSHKFVKR